MMKRFTSGWRKALLWSAAGVTALSLGVVAAWQVGALNGVALWGAGRALGYTISCGELSGGLLSRFTCTDLTLADAKGPFLRARGFTLAWNPWALVHNEATLDVVDLSGATLTRLPQSNAPSTSNDFLPGMKIAIGKLQLHGFTLAMSDAPKVCVNLGGRGRIGPTGFDAALALVRCAPQNGRLVLTGLYDKPSGGLTLSASGRDDGALAAALTGIADAGPTALSLDGNGTISAFNGKFSVRAQNVGQVAADFRARDLTATSLDAKFDIVPALLPSWAPQGAGTLVADLTRGPDGGFDISSADLDWGGVKGSAQLSLGADGRLNGQVKLATAQTMTVGGAAIGALDAHAKLSGTPARPALNGAATLSNLSSGAVAIAALRANFAVTPQPGGMMMASLVGSAQGAVLPAPAGGLLGPAFSFRASGTRAADGYIQAKATVNGSAARLGMVADLATGTGSGKLTLTVPDLAKANAGFSGSATADLDFAMLTLGGDLDGTLRVRGAQISASGAGGALGPAPSLTARLTGKNGAYTIGDLRIETAAVAAQGSAKRGANGAITAQLQTSRGDLAPLSGLVDRKLKGAFTFAAKVSGTEAHPVVAVTASAPRIRLDNMIVKDSALTLDARKSAVWEGTLAMKAATPGGAVDLLANLASQTDGWRAEIARGALGPATLSGHLAASGQTYSGALALKGDLLSPVAVVLDTPMHGTGTLTLEGAGHALRLALDLQKVSAGPLKNATVQAQANADSLSGPLQASLAVKDGANHLAAAAHGMLNPLAITASKFDGRWSGTDFALTAPATFTAKAGRFTLGQTVIAISEGLADARGRWRSGPA